LTLAASARLPPPGCAVLDVIARLVPTVEHGKIECEVLDLNRFGNVLLNVRESQLAESGLDGADAIQIDPTSGSGHAGWVSTYSDVESGDWGLIVDPRGWLVVIRGKR
jgi:S-adenosylmethionine hydrolase